MMIYAVGLAVLFVSALALSIRWLPGLHPVQLWLLPWAIATSLFALRLLPYEGPEPLTVLIVVGSTLGFCGGTLLGERVLGARIPPPKPGSVSIPALELAAGVALGLNALMLLAFLVDAGGEIGYLDVLLSSNRSRVAIVDGAAAATVTYLYAALAAAVLCALTAARSDERRRVWIAGALIATASTIFATGRTFTFMTLVAAAVAFALGGRRTPSPQRVAAGAGAVAVVFLAGFIAIGQLQNKTLETSTSLVGVPSVFRDEPALSRLALPYQYASAPLGALNLQVQVSPTWGESDGCATLRMGCAVLAGFGFDAEPESPSMPYTAPPLRWNTYTALDLPIRDGGTGLVIPIMALTGLVVGLAWSLCRSGRLFGLVAYPVLAGATLLATWQNNFASQLLWGAIMIVLVLAWGAKLVLARAGWGTR